MEASIILTQAFREWEWYDDTNTAKLYLHLLLRANTENRAWRGLDVKRDELVSNPRKLAIESGLSEGSVRASLKKLKRTKYVTWVSFKGDNIYHINHYEDYGRRMD